jgi:hypothetical protein
VQVEVIPLGELKARAQKAFEQQRRLQQHKWSRGGIGILGRGLAVLVALELLRVTLGGRVLHSLAGRPASPDALHEATRLWAEAIRAPLPEEQAIGKRRPVYFPKPKAKGRRLFMLFNEDAVEAFAHSRQPVTRHLQQIQSLSESKQPQQGRDVHEVRSVPVAGGSGHGSAAASRLA